MGIELPSAYEIKNKYLDMEYKDMEDYVNLQREKWKTYGCTIMCDGWTDPTKLSIINFMVYCKGITIFLKFVDALIGVNHACISVQIICSFIAQLHDSHSYSLILR